MDPNPNANPDPAATPVPLDLDRSVHDLCTAHPDLVPLLKELGFVDIVKPGMLATAGRFMTLPKGAALKKIDMGTVANELAKHGYTVGKQDPT
jgi:hypothetical protein